MPKKNPFLRSRRAPTVASELRFGDRAEHAVGLNGELNASSKKDLLQNIANLMNQQNGVISDSQATASLEQKKSRREALTAAFSSKEAHAELGEVLADELYQAGNRQGFARRLLTRVDLGQGQIPIARMRMKNVVAVIAGSMSKVQTQLVRDNLYYPPEFYVQVRPFVESREIQQSQGDVLEEKFVEATEGMMVQEDRLWYTMAKSTANIVNPATTITGQMNPTNLATLRNQVTRWNIPAATWLFANDIWIDIIGDATFAAIIDPVSKAELLLTGQLGSMLGMTLLSDGYRHPQHKVLNQGDMFIVGDPINHGQITDRGGIESTPIDVSHENVPGRGWHLVEIISMLIANARSVAWGNRLS